MSLTTDLRIVIGSFDEDRFHESGEPRQAYERLKQGINCGAVVLFPTIEDAAERIMTLEARNQNLAHAHDRMSNTLDAAIQRIRDLEDEAKAYELTDEIEAALAEAANADLGKPQE